MGEELEDYLDPNNAGAGIDWDAINARGGVTGHPTNTDPIVVGAPAGTATNRGTTPGATSVVRSNGVTQENYWANRYTPEVQIPTFGGSETAVFNPGAFESPEPAPSTTTTATPTTTPARSSTPWDEAYFRTTFGAPRTPNELLALESRITEAGGKVLRNAAGVAGKIMTPDGRIVDVIYAAGAGGQGFQWLEGGGNVPGGGEFTDPWGSAFEQAISERLARLLGAPNRENLEAYMARLLEADKNKQKNVERFVGQTRDRIEELQQPAYTAGDEAVIRAKAFDALERRRQQTLQNDREQVYARGFAPTSGIVQQATADTNQAFEESRTGIESNLLLSAMQETQRRKDQALSLNQLVEQALSGGDLASLELLSRTTDLENMIYEQNQAREREYLSTMGLPLELIQQRAQLGNQTASTTTSPESVLASIVALFQQNANGRATNAQTSANNMAGLGQVLAILTPLLNRTSTARTGA